MLLSLVGLDVLPRYEKRKPPEFTQIHMPAYQDGAFECMVPHGKLKFRIRRGKDAKPVTMEFDITDDLVAFVSALEKRMEYKS